MAEYENLELVRVIKERGDTNSRIDLMNEIGTDNFFIRKTIFGIDHPLYQAIFTREIQALYKLNSCSNIVQIFSHKNMKISKTNEKVGCIFLEYIFGETLSKTDLTKLSSKDKFSILKQLLIAIEVAHSKGIIHRDINPNNIMITDNKELKVIDFGICKIKEMINSSTLYLLGTNLYSAPEVHLHSENATEQSDLYSLGAIIYYIFTGKNPPLPSDFQQELDKTSGIDIDLKPIIKKLVMENPKDRYTDIFDLRVSLSKLFNRFLNINQQINVVLDYESFCKLKKQNLLPKNVTLSDATKSYISNNFIELFAFKNNDEIYSFLGLNYLIETIYDEKLNIFYVSGFKKIVPFEREQYKRKFAEICANIQIIDPRFIHRQNRNDSLEIKNIIDNFYNEYMSKNNVDSEYKFKYGAWRDLLNLTKDSIEKNIVRFAYDSYTTKDGILTFVLSKGVFLGDELLNREKNFVYEQPHKGNNKKVSPKSIGFYEDDYFEKDHVILNIRYDSNKPHLPLKGSICLDYRKDLLNVQRQLDALDSIEKEDYSCPFNLKRIISGLESPKTKVLKNDFAFFNKNLDLSQQTAVKKALNSESLCIIQGPPGTGKTNVVIEIIRQILKENKKNPELLEKKILLVSQSHPAVDKMLDDLIVQMPVRPNLIRIGRDEKCNIAIKEKYGLEYVKEKWIADVRANCEKTSQQICNELNISQDQFKTYFKEYEKTKIKDYDRDNINHDLVKHIQNQTESPKKEKLRKILEIQQQWIEQLSQCEEVELYIIKSTTIIAGTCTGFISNRIIKQVNFDYLIIDEAAKATFPELAVSFNKANNIIMVGDHKQLPPILDNDIINKNKQIIDLNSLSEGIFEKLYDVFPEDNKHKLIVQYRMHPAIGTLISNVFYDNEILNGVETDKRKIDVSSYSNIAIEWISTSIYPKNERYETEQGNYPQRTFRNNLEIKIIRDKLAFLDLQLEKKIKVAVITAYSAQKYALSNMIRQKSYQHLDIEVDTVDAFQGSQKEIIIYSTVRSSSNPYKIGFLRSEARLNVAFSRAQALLIIVGDKDFLNNKNIPHNKFPDIINYIKNSDYCRIIDA
jgi:Superfamily I DNA and RNA helicases and helicase subunits